VKLKIAWIGKTEEAAIQMLSEQYLKRLTRYAEAEGVGLKDEAALLRLLSGAGMRAKYKLILLESGGKQHSSEEFAEWLRDQQEISALPLLFAVGAADGFSAQTRKVAALTLSLGKMTLPHQLARVVLLEQLYRAFTILNRHPYHIGHSARRET
jgi:23S rRNA (pseudouridine1915-N3)-methyltransferase